MKVFIVLKFLGKDTKVHSVYLDQTDPISAVAHLTAYSKKHKDLDKYYRPVYDYIVKTAKTNLKGLIK